MRDVPFGIEVVLPPDQRWRDRLHEAHGAAVEDRPMRSFRWDGRASELAALTRPARPGTEVVRMESGHLSALAALDLAPHGLQTYGSVEAFERDGIGFAVVSSTGSILSACTSYAVSEGGVEIAVCTVDEARRQGHASAAAAAMVLHCLERGKALHWNAANPVSKLLAMKLGFVPGPLVDSVVVTAPEG